MAFHLLERTPSSPFRFERLVSLLPNAPRGDCRSMIHCDDPFLKMLDETRWHKPPRKRRDLRSTDCERVASLAKSFRLAEACASRTNAGHLECVSCRYYNPTN